MEGQDQQITRLSSLGWRTLFAGVSPFLSSVFSSLLFSLSFSLTHTLSLYLGRRSSIGSPPQFAVHLLSLQMRQPAWLCFLCARRAALGSRAAFGARSRAVCLLARNLHAHTMALNFETLVLRQLKKGIASNEERARQQASETVRSQ